MVQRDQIPEGVMDQELYNLYLTALQNADLQVNESLNTREDGDDIFDNQFPLDANETATSDWFDMKDQPGGLFYALSDVEPASVQVEWSDDGNTPNDEAVSPTDVTIVEEQNFYVSLHYFTQPQVDRYARIVYENGSSAQDTVVGDPESEAIFWLFNQAFEGSFLTLNESLNDFTVAQLTRSVISATDPDGDFVNISATRKGDLETSIDAVGNNAYRYAPRGDVTLYGSQVTASKVPQIERQFHEDDPNEELTITSTGSASATKKTGFARFSSGTDSSASISAETFQTIDYLTSAEIMASFAVSHIQPPTSAGDYSMIGLSDGTNGFEVGYKGTDFGVRRLRGGSEQEFVKQADFNIDPLDGSATSEYQRDGDPVAIDHTTQDMWRVRYGWYGVAPTHVEVLAPDGHWVAAHKFDYTTEDIPQTDQPNLPIRVFIEKNSSDSTDIKQNVNALYGGVMANVSIAQQPDGDYVAEKAGGEATFTDKLLTANETYTSEWVDTDGWGSIEVQASSDQPSADEGVKIEFTSDANDPNPNVDATRTLTLTQNAVDSGNALRAVIPTRLDGYRIKYTNGSTGQNEFKLVTTLLTDVLSETTSLSTPIDKQTLSQTNRSVLYAEDDAGEISKITRNNDSLRSSITNHEIDTPIRALTSFDTTQQDVPDLDGGGPLQVLTDPLDGRKIVAIKNDGSNPVYLGPDEFVRDTNGMPINVGETGHFELDDTVDLWMVAEDATGSTTTHTLDPTSGSTSGTATSPDNVVSSDDSWAIYDTIDEAIDAAGYDATAAQTRDIVTDVDIGFEGSKDGAPGTQTVSHEQTTSAIQTGGTSITTDSSLTGNSEHYYTAFIALRDQSKSVSSVDGLGLSWSRKTTATNTNGVKMEFWAANGTSDITGGSVTANFGSAVASASISANRWSGVSNSSPIDTTISNTGGTTGWDVTVSDSSANGRVIGGAAVNVQTSNSPGSPDVEHSDRNLGGANSERLTEAVQSRSAGGGSDTSDGTWATAGNWAAIGVSLNPEALVDPEMLLEYEVGSEGKGSTTLTETLDNTSDETFKQDVTGDRDWSYSDIDNTTLTLTLQNGNTENAEIDHIFIEYTEADSGSTQRVAFTELA